jgi:acyl-CoA dehydrogenase
VKALPPQPDRPVSVSSPDRPSHRATRAPLPPFTEAHEEFRRRVRSLVERELTPHAHAWEETRHFPDEVFRLLARHGCLGLKYPERYGGEGGDHLADAVFTEELSRCGSGGVAAGIGAHIGIATPPIWKFGTEEQKQRFLVPAIRGERIAALAITEPDAGSDVASIRTSARPVDGGWIVNGAKMFITNGVRAHVIVTAVKTTGEGGHRGLSFLLVERGPGVEARPIEKLGWHASDTALISLDDVFVPRENLLGRENEGFYLIMANFQWERLLMALGALGAMQAAFEQTLAFAGGRRAFGRPVGAHQAIRHKLAEIATKLETGRALTYHALRLFTEGTDAVREVTMAKLQTQRACVDVLDECLQIHGGAGYMGAAGLERGLRDARLGPIGGGTDEIMREILGKSLGL